MRHFILMTALTALAGCQSQYMVTREDLPQGVWETIEIPVVDMPTQKGERTRGGDPLAFLQLRILGGDGPSHFDDIEIVELGQ